MGQINRRTRYVIIFILLFAAAFYSVRVVWHRPLKNKFSSSTAVYDEKQKLLRLTLSNDDKYRLWLQLEDVSPLFVQTILLHEDKKFYSHFALNPYALARAAYHSYIKKDRLLGGSTITMQLARLIYKINSRTIPGKIEQVARAIELEVLYSKKEILEAYLNLIPYGRNIEGVGAASLVYFGLSAKKLPLPVVLSLAIIPQSPAKRARDADNNEKLLSARQALFKKLVKIHPDFVQYESAVGSQIGFKTIQDLPFLAPHFTNFVLSRNHNNPQIITALDFDLQKLIERQVENYLRANSSFGVKNASVLLVDSRTMEVKAMQGSADFFSETISGQVNGTISKRSPGSALKPFVYALALDQGLINPATLLKDTPLSVGPFSPENFDGQFAGPISAKDALIRSRNVPAVMLSSRLSNPSFYDFLKMAGISGLKSENHYGPSLVIGGGGEVTMEELVGLYAMLANGGLLQKIKITNGEVLQNGVRLLSEEASYMVLDMLKNSPRPDERYEPEWVKDRMEVSWKTGTSYGFKDAWTVGVFGPYVMAVWMGNFDGEANPYFVGIRAAAPLFFRIAEAIKAEGVDLKSLSKNFPKNLTTVEVCALSGGLPTKHCHRRKKTWFIPGKSPIEECQVHREVMVEDVSGLRACYPFKASVHSEIFEFWPSDILKIFREAGIPRRVPPETALSCRPSFATYGGIPPKITSPLTGLTYILRSLKNDNDAISFKATTDADTREVYWFVNNSYVGKSATNSAFQWRATPGNFTVSAVDDMGRQDSRELKVSLVE